MSKSTFKKCNVLNCNKFARSNSSNHCEMHYYRIRRNKSLEINKKTVSENLFKTITRKEAWILGLIWTDGCLRKNTISITSKDLDMLKLVQDITTGNDLCITKRKNQNAYDFSFSNQVIAERLRNIGLHENKSFTIEFPKIKKSLIWDFIRGVIDGDGCVHLCKKKIKIV